MNWNKLKKNHQNPHKQSLDEITSLEKNIKAKGGDPSQYSSISADGLKKKFDEINNKINQKTEGLKKEYEKQSQNEKLLEEYNKLALEYVSWSNDVLKQIMADHSGSLEEQLKSLKKIGEEAIKKKW